MKPNRLIVLCAFACGFVSCSSAHTPLLVQIAHYDTPGWAHDVTPDGNQLFVSDRQGGFAVFDRNNGWSQPRIDAPVRDVISLAPNSGRPVLASRFEGLVLTAADGKPAARIVLGDIANAAVCRDGMVFAAYGIHGLVIARASTNDLTLISRLPSPGWSHDVKLRGNRALLADWTYGMRVVDVSGADHPVEIAVLPTEATAICIAVQAGAHDTIAAVAEGHAGVSLVTFDAAGRPVRIAKHRLGLHPADPPHPESGGWAHGVALCGNYMFVANWKRGLAVFDIRNPRQPLLIEEVPTSGTALGVKAEFAPEGTITVFLADGEEGLRVFKCGKQ